MAIVGAGGKTISGTAKIGSANNGVPYSVQSAASEAARRRSMRTEPAGPDLRDGKIRGTMTGRNAKQ